MNKTATVNGAAVSISTTAPGQSANVAFSNASSRAITIHWTSGTYTSCNMTVTNSVPSQVGSGSCSGSSGSLSLGTLPSGSYNILIDPQGAITGGLSLTVTSP